MEGHRGPHLRVSSGGEAGEDLGEVGGGEDAALRAVVEDGDEVGAGGGHQGGGVGGGGGGGGGEDGAAHGVADGRVGGGVSRLDGLALAEGADREAAIHDED